MADQKELRDRFEAVRRALGIGNKRKPSLPLDAVKRGIELVNELARVVEPHSVMTPDEKRVALSHPVSMQIKSLLERDKRTEEFFSRDYLLRHFEALPKDWKLVWKKKPRTRPHAKNALIYYFYHKSKNDNFRGLKQFRDKLEEDFGNDPESKRLERLNATYRALLTLPTKEDIVAKLKELFPTELEVKAFANDIPLKLPEKGGGSLHERVGEAIHEKGGVTRL